MSSKVHLGASYRTDASIKARMLDLVWVRLWSCLFCKCYIQNALLLKKDKGEWA